MLVTYSLPYFINSYFLWAFFSIKAEATSSIHTGTFTHTFDDNLFLIQL